jgi:GNAT superfamily N-acetyltransferase
MSVHRDYRRGGIARRLIVALVQLAADVGVTRLVVETNAEWRDAQRFYEAFGFTFTHSSPGAFGRENFYELPV